MSHKNPADLERHACPTVLGDGGQALQSRWPAQLVSYFAVAWNPSGNLPNEPLADHVARTHDTL